MQNKGFYSTRRKRLNYAVRHTVPGGWCGLWMALLLVGLFLLFLMTSDIPICVGLPPICWLAIIPILAFAMIFWMGMLGGFPSDFISEDYEETAPLSETPEIDKIYDPTNKLEK